jgi:hypothetical protein
VLCVDTHEVGHGAQRCLARLEALQRLLVGVVQGAHVCGEMGVHLRVVDVVVLHRNVYNARKQNKPNAKQNHTRHGAHVYVCDSTLNVCVWGGVWINARESFDTLPLWGASIHAWPA